MRNAYGRNVFERHDLALRWGSAGAPVRRPFDPQISDGFALGADMRVAYLYDRAGESPTAEASKTTLDTMLVMQADLYAAAELGQHATLYLDIGALGNFEAFVMLDFGLGEAQQAAGTVETSSVRSPNGLPWRRGGPLAGYVKFGQFVPAYGLRLVNHSAYIREGINIHPRFRDVGVEAGLFWRQLTVQAAYFRGDLNGEDETDGSVASVRVSNMHRIGSLNLLAGVSGHYFDEVAANPVFRGFTPPGPVRELRFGGFVGVALGRLTYLGEMDVVLDRMRGEQGAVADQDRYASAYVSYQELSFVPFQGLDVLVTYEFWDPNTEFKDPQTLAGSGVHRLGGSLRLFPFHFVEALVQYRRTVSDDRQLGSRQDLTLMLHGFY